MVPSRARPAAASAATLAVVAVLGGCDSRTSDWPGGGRRAPSPGPTATVTLAPDAAVAETGCPDPIVGVWTARRFDGATWYEHRLTFMRVGGALTCAQESRSWLGTIDNALPPPCSRAGHPATSYHHVTLRCDVIEAPPQLMVRSREILQNIHTCNDEVVGYNLDSFAGNPVGNTWSTVNNDGGDDVDMPYRFRRLSCE